MGEPAQRQLRDVFPSRKAMRRCIVDGCEWRNDDDVTVDSDLSGGDPFDLKAMRFAITRVVEVQLRAHLLTDHDVVDFARTINRLRGELADVQGRLDERAVGHEALVIDADPDG